MIRNSKYGVQERKMERLLFFFLFMILPGLAWTQKDRTAGEYSKNKEVTFDGKRYAVFNNYLTIGAGYGRNTYTRSTFFNMGADYNFHIRKLYFQAGGFFGGKYFGDYNQMQFHLGFGKRFEMDRVNLAGYLGPSYAVMNRSYQDSNKVYVKFERAVGLSACVQFTYKFKYDLGIGTCFFADFNKSQAQYGIRLEFYFSGAYRRAVKGDQNLNQQPDKY